MPSVDAEVEIFQRDDQTNLLLALSVLSCAPFVPEPEQNLDNVRKRFDLTDFVRGQEKLTYLCITNSGPHRQNSGGRMGLGPLPVLKTLRDKEPFSPAWRDSERNG
jgi:hypothetical protein